VAVGRSRLYYGWYIVAMAALAMVGTLPGRTQGLGLITEPLLTDLGLGRVTYAAVNFWATIIGALGALGIGRLIDRLGIRIVLTAVAAALGLIVCFMSQVTSLAALAVAMTLTRAAGQSALSVVSIAMVGLWFVRRVNTAMAIYSVALSIGFMIAFPVVGSLVQAWGWRATWLAIGVALILALAPASWLVVRSRPETIGLHADGEVNREAALARGAVAAEPPGHRWREAMSTGAFWVFALGAALYGLVASGIGLFNESILAERGFGSDAYYQTLVVTAMTALVGNFLGGWLAKHVQLTRLMALSLFILAAGLIALPHLASLALVMAWATAMGLGGGLVMVLFFSVWPAVFGRRHLGRIQGMAQALTVLASAMGPLLLAWCVASTGSYAAMFRILAAVITVTAAAALIVEIPKPVVDEMPIPQRAG
jgi:MFS family permease